MTSKYLERFSVNRNNIILFLIILLGFFLRFYNIGLQHAWLDELSTLQVSDPDITFAETHILIMTREGFPHLYFLSLKYLSWIFGHSIEVSRVFSAVSGTASIYVIYLLLKELKDKHTGIIAALLFAVNFFHIYHSQEGRPYAFMVFLILFASYRMVFYMKNPCFRNAIIMGIATGIIANAHPMGLLNIGVIYATLGVFLLLQKDKVLTFKQLFIAGVSTLIVCIPVYQIIVRLGKFTSFWIPEPNLANIKQAFVQLLGGSEIIFYLYLSALLIFFALAIYRIFREKDEKRRELTIMTLTLMSFWFIFNAGVIIVKSYLDISLILDRYFIGCLPAFIIALAYCLGLIKNRIVSFGLLAVLALYSVFYIYGRDYYTTRYKAAWQEVANEIIANNTQSDRVYSAYGYVSNILFKGTPTYDLMKEIDFASYLATVRNNIIAPEDFWYFDGNNRPYNLSTEDHLYLEENYILTHQIDKLDCWARHYKLKNPSKVVKAELGNIYLSSFEPKVLDDSGNLYMFSNGSMSTKPLHLSAGWYELTLHGNSLPIKPIEGENAHIVVSVNDVPIFEQTLSEKVEKKEHIHRFEIVSSSPKILSISFDNDYAVDDLDRNVILYYIALKKIEKVN